MTVVDGHQAGAWNEPAQDAAVGERHDRIVCACNYKRRWRKKPQPGKTAPTQGGNQLQVVAVIARPADMAQMLAHELGRGTECAAVYVAGDALHVVRVLVASRRGHP